MLPNLSKTPRPGQHKRNFSDPVNTFKTTEKLDVPRPQETGNSYD